MKMELIRLHAPFDKLVQENFCDKHSCVKNFSNFPIMEQELYE